MDVAHAASDSLCKGSIALGSGCGKCTRCLEQIAQGVKPTPRASGDAAMPRPFNITDEGELGRLMRETLGYARTSLHKKDGTDLRGREFAHDALKHALMMGYKLVPPAAS